MKRKAETAKLCNDTDCPFPRTSGGPMPWTCLEKYRKLLQTVTFCMLPLHKGLMSSPPRSRSSAALPALLDGSHYVVPCRLRASLRMACSVSSASCIFPSSSWPTAPPPACTSDESSSSSCNCCRYRSTCNHRGSGHWMLGDCLKGSQKLEHQHSSAQRAGTTTAQPLRGMDRWVGGRSPGLSLGCSRLGTHSARSWVPQSQACRCSSHHSGTSGAQPPPSCSCRLHSERSVVKDPLPFGLGTSFHPLPLLILPNLTFLYLICRCVSSHAGERDLAEKHHLALESALSKHHSAPPPGFRSKH